MRINALRTFRDLLLLIAFAAPMFVGVAQVYANTPVQRGLVVVMNLPWSDPEPHVKEAGGWIVGPTRAPFGVLSTSDTDSYPRALADMGYWTIRNAALLRLMCGGGI